MGNLALNKLPKEIDIWKKSELATDGIAIDYTGGSGFALSHWPCVYTLDFEKEQLIKSIRFLLWDGLGDFHNNKNAKVDPRKYKFTLSISLDGIYYTQIFSNQNQDGSNGWFVFNFLNDCYARFVRLTGHYNSANKEFHIVEFEVHNEIPAQISSSNLHAYDIPGGLPSNEEINGLVDRIISTRVEILQGVEQKISLLDKSLQQSSDALQQIELIKQCHDFQTESINNNKRSQRWLYASITTLVLFLALLVWLVFFSNHSSKVITDASANVITKEYTDILLIAFYVGKAFFLSTILFMLTWFLKNYRSERHNYIINKHKAMTLAVATSILTKKDFSKIENGKIFNQATEIIFTHQASGYSTDDESGTPNIVNTILQRGLAKAEA